MSRERTSRIIGTGRFLPPSVLSNAELYQRRSIQEAFDVERARSSLKKGNDDVAGLTPVEVFDRWARQVTGIRQRRVVGTQDDLTTEIMCTRAGERALEQAGVDPMEVDLVLVASVTPSDNVPNAACTVGHLLGAHNAGGFTLNGACTGFVHALATAHAFVCAGMGSNVLAIAGDTLTRITNYSDPTTAVLFSDGAAAALVTASQTPGVLGPPSFNDDYAREHLFIVGQGWELPGEPSPKLKMGGGPRVLRRAILAMEQTASQALERAGVPWASVDLVIPHQANLRITRGLEAQATLEGARVIHTIEDYGNCSAATVGIALDETLRGEHGSIPDPARIVLTAVGGGYTTAALVMDVHTGG